MEQEATRVEEPDVCALGPHVDSDPNSRAAGATTSLTGSCGADAALPNKLPKTDVSDQQVAAAEGGRQRISRTAGGACEEPLGAGLGA